MAEPRPHVALIRPRYHTHIVTPPLGVLYLAACLRRAGHEVQLVDALRDRLDEAAAVERTGDAPVVGLTCMSDHHRQTIALARAMKRAGKVVVLGGPHVWALPSESLAETGADAAVLGEGEEVLPALLADWPRLSAGEHVMRPGDGRGDGALVEDLDTLPEPAWDLAPPASYPIAPHGAMVRRFPAAPVISSRGCAFRCTFCTAPTLHRRRVRFRSPGRVLDEIERLARKFGVREIHFEDNNLTARREHVEGICEGLLARGLDLTWACPNGVRTEHLDDRLLALMRRAGCHMLAFGIESGTQELLDGIKKDVTLDRMLEAVERARRAGIVTQGFFIIGLPGETCETIERTIRLAVGSGLDRAQFHLLDVLPGSEMWETIGPERVPGWERRGFQEVVWTPPGLTDAELVRAQRRAFRRFYLRPRILWSFLKNLRLRQVPHFYRRLADFGLVRRARP